MGSCGGLDLLWCFDLVVVTDDRELLLDVEDPGLGTIVLDEELALEEPTAELLEIDAESIVLEEEPGHGGPAFELLEIGDEDELLEI